MPGAIRRSWSQRFWSNAIAASTTSETLMGRGGRGARVRRPGNAGRHAGCAGGTGRLAARLGGARRLVSRVRSTRLRHLGLTLERQLFLVGIEGCARRIDRRNPSSVRRRMMTSRATSSAVYRRCEPAACSEGPRP
ncbi:hypothetical protein NKG05_05050 [Oerskovia sp. M15]